MRRPLLVSLGGGLLLLVLAGLAVGWYALGEERRTARLLSRFLSRQVGIPLRVERARAEAARLTLRGVSIPPGEHWRGSLEIRELRVEGGVLPVVFPRGRAVSMVAVATSVTLAKESAPLSAPAPDTLAAIRSALLRFLDWPAVVSLEMKGGEIRSGGETLGFDLKAEKSGDGKLVVRLALRRPGDPPALTIEARGAAAGPDARVAVTADGDPRRLGPFWPSTLPLPSRITAESDLAVSATPELAVSATLTATPADGGNPMTARLSGRYRPTARRVDVPLLALRWGPALQLDLAGSVEDVDTAPRLTVKMSGTVDGSRITGEGTYAAASGGLEARLDLRPFASGPLLERAGYARPPLEVKAESVGLTLDGKAEGKDRVRVQGALGLEGVAMPAWTTGARLRANVRFDGAVSRRDGRLALAALDRGEVSLASPAGEIGRLSVRSRSAGQLVVQGGIPDLSRVPVFEAFPARLSGDARLEGALDWTGPRPRFGGNLAAHVAKGEVSAGGTIALSGLRVSLPLAWGPGEEAPTGTVTAESLAAFGFVLRRLASPALVRGSVVSLPEISYAHYGGSGKGNARLDLGGAPVPLSLRLEGEGVDLATLTTEYGLTVGRITGTVRYLLVLQHSQARGLIAAGQAASDPPGGDVNIEALKKLLAYVESDPSGIVTRALENLSVFSYESLSGDIRVGPQGGRVSLSLEGKKRFGIFPGPVRAINFQNVPLSLLVKTFGQSRRDSQ